MSDYPWIKDSKDTTSGNTGYLHITAPNGLYSHKIKYNDNIMIFDDDEGIKLTTGVNKGLYLNSERITPGSGAKGAQGAAGAAGAKGAQGEAGAAGAAGAKGEQGAAGAAGSAGAQGAAGTNGSAGSAGAQGAAGTTGATGATGQNSLQTLNVTTGIGENHQNHSVAYDISNIDLQAFNYPSNGFNIKFVNSTHFPVLPFGGDISNNSPLDRSGNPVQLNHSSWLKIQLNNSDWKIIDGYGLKPTDNIAYIPMYWYKL